MRAFVVMPRAMADADARPGNAIWLAAADAPNAVAYETAPGAWRGGWNVTEWGPTRADVTVEVDTTAPILKAIAAMGAAVTVLPDAAA